MTDMEIKKWSARRYLYTQVDGPALDWQCLLAEIDDVINQNPALTPYGPECSFYFFVLPNDMNFLFESAWFGRYIIGHALFEENEFGLYDMSAATSIHFPLEQMEFEELTPRSIQIKAVEFRKKASLYTSLSSVWKLTLNLQTGKLGLDFYQEYV